MQDVSTQMSLLFFLTLIAMSLHQITVLHVSLRYNTLSLRMHVVNVYIRTHSTDGKDMFMRIVVIRCQAY